MSGPTSAFRLPDLGEGLEEAEIVAWHVGVGDHVVADQPLVSVETAKAVVEIPSPQSGRIAALHGEPGAVVKVGSVIVTFAEGEAPDRGAIVGELAEEAPAPKPAARPVVRATPAVRALAARLGVDLAQVRASGPDGSVTRADVEAAAGGAAPGGEGRAEPLRGVRRAMAQAMTRAGAEVVPATVSDEALVEHWPEGTSATLRLVRALLAGCRAEPALNAWFDGATQTRQLHGRVDLGIAVDTPDGLFVPVLRAAGGLDEAGLEEAFASLKQAVRARSAAPEAFQRPTVTLSNFGTLGGRYAALVVVPPQVAILGAGRIAPRVVAAEGRPAVARTLPLSLTFDHRAVTGGEAARFLAAVIAALESDGP